MSETNNQEHNKVTQLYGAFGASLVLMLVPSVMVALAALLLFLGVLIAAYIIRSGAEKGSLCENHATFIIRTIWIGSFFSAITLSIACTYMVENIDNNPMLACAESILANAQTLMMSNDFMALANLVSPCMDNFLAANNQVLMISMAIAALPILLYFILRFSRGISRALKGYRVSNPKSWL